MLHTELLSFLLSILLIIISAWNLNTFIRLNNASKDYSSNQALSDSCHVSKTYVKSGKVIAIAVLCVSTIVLIVNSVLLYKK